MPSNANLPNQQSHLRGALTVLNDIAAIPALHNVPYVGPAIALALSISQLCENVRYHRESAEDLHDRCTKLKKLLDIFGPIKPPPELQEWIDGLEITLHEIQQHTKKLAGLSFFWAVIRYSKNNIQIQKCIERMDRKMEELNAIGAFTTLQLQQYLSQRDSGVRSERMQLSEKDLSTCQTIIASLEVSDENNEGPAHHQKDNFMLVTRELLKKVSLADPVLHVQLQDALYNFQRRSHLILPPETLAIATTPGDPVSTLSTPDTHVRKGRYLRTDVSIKYLRFMSEDGVLHEEVAARFDLETNIWAKLWLADRKGFILPFLGAGLDEDNIPYMVSPWMEKGDASSYFKSPEHQEEHRGRVITGIAEAVVFLHTFDPCVVHGDLRGANVMMDDTGRPLLKDFGLAMMILSTSTSEKRLQTRHNTNLHRWRAPEVLEKIDDDDLGTTSPKADVFSFGMTVLELVTNEKPFSKVKTGDRAGDKIKMGVRPPRPETDTDFARGLDDNLWALMERCWSQNPEERPDMSNVFESLCRWDEQ